MNQSEKLFKKAQELLVGGVNSPVRAFKAVGGTPRFLSRGKGPFVWDADGKKYADFVGSWGPLFLGQTHPSVEQALRRQLRKGWSFGASTDLEIQLAELICKAIPSIEKIRFVSSGTEAVMSAIRLARGFTHRDLVVKFDGCYHGHSDGMLVRAGSGAATFAMPDSAGVPQTISNLTLTLPYNDPVSVQNCFKKFGPKIAALIVEPAAGNMGLVPPEKNFLETLRKVCNQYKTVLIFDEVITGFRLGWNGAQGFYKVVPDLTCLGKIVGGGFPVGAFGGSQKIMDYLSPLGAVYQAGTLSGNPAAMAAGIATLQTIQQKNPYKKMARNMEHFAGAIQEKIDAHTWPLQLHFLGSMITLFFTEIPVTDYASAKTCDTKKFAKFFHGLLENGIYWPPAQLETAFISAAHHPILLDQCSAKINRILKNIF